MKKPLKKRTLALILACAAALALMVPALACGGHGRHHGRQTQVTVCPVSGCEAAGRHVHNGVTYCGYAHESGVCDGRCLALCPVEGCETVGRHVHDGVTYCGADHDCGYCDGSCPLYQAPSYSGAQYRGHHGCHH